MRSTTKEFDVKANFVLAKMLIIEDNNDQWTLIKRSLDLCLSEVSAIHVTNSKDALDLLATWQFQEWELPRLILLDLYLPSPEEGLNLLEELKRSFYSRIPVIVLSASNQETDIEKAYQFGASAYQVKPSSFEDWLFFFKRFRTYWWETVSLPPIQLGE